MASEQKKPDEKKQLLKTDPKPLKNGQKQLND